MKVTARADKKVETTPREFQWNAIRNTPGVYIPTAYPDVRVAIWISDGVVIRLQAYANLERTPFLISDDHWNSYQFIKATDTLTVSFSND